MKLTVLALILIIIASSASMPCVTALNDGQSREGIIILFWTNGGEYLAGEEINVSIGVENHNEWSVDLTELQFKVFYTSFNALVLNDEIGLQKRIPPGDIYFLSKVFFLPKHTPPGKYNMFVSFIGSDGQVLGFGSSEIVVEANYGGIIRAVGILLLYTSAVLALFALIFYSRPPKEELR